MQFLEYLYLSQSTLWNILHKDLDMYPYKIQLVQELQPQDHGFRRSFVDWALENLAADPYFYRKIVFSDEAHFSLNEFVNKQNCRIWSETNPKAFFETSMYPEKCTVWCALHAGGIIGPYFFGIILEDRPLEYYKIIYIIRMVKISRFLLCKQNSAETNI